LVQKILQKTESKEKRKENKGLVLGQSQLLMLSSGKIVSVEELRDSSLYPSIISWNDSFTSNRILSIEKSNADILHLISSHGRNIYCSASTKLVRSPYSANKYITAKSINKYPDNFKGSPKEVSACALRHLPYFGAATPSKLYLDSLGSSLTRAHDKRPNHYIKQWIPSMLSSLSKEALSYILNNFIIPLKTIKHLTPNSKDIMILLLSKLFISFDGQTRGHKATEGCGTIKLMNNLKDLPLLKKESIRFVKKIKQDSYKIIFKDKSIPIISGLLVCPK